MLEKQQKTTKQRLPATKPRVKKKKRTIRNIHNAVFHLTLTRKPETEPGNRLTPDST
jgi:hypothetical protein